MCFSLSSEVWDRDYVAVLECQLKVLDNFVFIYDFFLLEKGLTLYSLSNLSRFTLYMGENKNILMESYLTLFES